jgi:hypothetical protein
MNQHRVLKRFDCELTDGGGTVRCFPGTILQPVEVEGIVMRFVAEEGTCKCPAALFYASTVEVFF